MRSFVHNVVFCLLEKEELLDFAQSEEALVGAAHAWCLPSSYLSGRNAVIVLISLVLSHSTARERPLEHAVTRCDRSVKFHALRFSTLKFHVRADMQSSFGRQTAPR